MAKFDIASEGGYCRSDVLRKLVGRIYLHSETAGIVDRSSRPADIADDKWQSESHSLECDVASGLAVAGEEEGISGPVEIVDLFARQSAVEADPISDSKGRGERFAGSSVEAVADNVERDRHLPDVAECSDSVLGPLGRYEPTDKEKPKGAAGSSRSIYRTGKLIKGCLAHNLEETQWNALEEVTNIRGNSQDAAGLHVCLPEQRVMEQAESV